jgi:hypothetical protein
MSKHFICDSCGEPIDEQLGIRQDGPWAASHNPLSVKRFNRKDCDGWFHLCSLACMESFFLVFVARERERLERCAKQDEPEALRTDQ